MEIYTETIKHLVVFGNGKKLFEKQRDLDAYGTFVNGQYHLSHSDRCDSIVKFDLLVKKARKEDLDRKYSYVIGATLYVYAPDVHYEYIGEFKINEIYGATNYKQFCRLHLPVKVSRRHYERLLVPDGWKLPEGASWDKGPDQYHIPDEQGKESYRHYLESIGKEFQDYNLVHVWTAVEEENEVVYPSDCYTRTDKDSGRKRREKIADIMNDCIGLGGCQVSHCDVEEMLKCLDIRIKGEENGSECN